MLAQPLRLRLLGAKVVALGVVTLLTSAGSIGAAMCVAVVQQPTWGSAFARFLVAVDYWCAVALMSFTIGLATRNTVVPITVLGVNLPAISVSFLLLNLTPLARSLPDLAGATLLLRDVAFTDPLPPLTGGLVMAAWTVELLGICLIVASPLLRYVAWSTYPPGKAGSTLIISGDGLGPGMGLPGPIGPTAGGWSCPDGPLPPQWAP